jgi:S-adenosylmethionine hydrolase
VVDPGVGSDRAILAARFADGLLAILPDNGLIGALMVARKLVQLVSVTRTSHFLPNVCPVFHGRDIFAPAAAKLACGLELKKLGEDLEPEACQPWPWPAPHLTGNVAVGQIIYVDGFGNLITNLDDAILSRLTSPEVLLNGRVIRLYEHYAAVAVGQSLALTGSYGYLEVAVRNGSAERTLGAATGDRIEVRST